MLFIFQVYLCYAVLSVPCSVEITCWESADLLTLLCVMFFLFLSHSHLVWYFIVSIPDNCLLLYFVRNKKISLKPHSHCADVATVHPDAGQPVYRDAPGHISQKINCVLTLPTLPRYSPGSRESKTPVDPRFTTEHLRCSTVQHGGATVHAGIPRCYPGCLR